MSARPSRRDLRQLRDFAGSPLLRCPAPVLLVIGGEPVGTWEAQAVVVRRGGPTLPLRPVTDQDRESPGGA
jgi:hypothetical protein